MDAALQQILRIRKRRPAHGTEDAPGQREARQLLQAALFGNIDRHVTAAGKDFLSLFAAVQHLRQHEQRFRHTAGVQRTLDDMRAFGNEKGIFDPVAAAQLGFSQAGIDIQLRCVEIRNLNKRVHGFSIPVDGFRRFGRSAPHIISESPQQGKRVFGVSPGQKGLPVF